MAELAIKVGDRSARPEDYKDGDIIAAFNQRAIRSVHAQHICHVKVAERNRDGLILTTDVLRDWYEATHEYRYRRVSRTEIRRTNIATSAETIITGPEFNVTISGQPTQLVTFQENESGRVEESVLIVARTLGVARFNDRGKLLIDDVVTSYVTTGESPTHTYVEEFVRRRRKSNRHYMFGEDGSEIWYLGKKDYSHAKLDVVWAAIEAKTSNVEASFTRWPISVEQPPAPMLLTVPESIKQKHIAQGNTAPLDVSYFSPGRVYVTGTEGTTVMAIRGGQESRSHLFIDVDDFTDEESGILVEQEIDDTDLENPVVLQARRHKIDWRADLALTGTEQNDISDRSKAVDVRENKRHKASVVRRKPDAPRGP